MTQILLILIGATILLVLVTSTGRRTVVRVYEKATGQTARKRENKGKVLALLGERADGASNEEIAEHLGVSPRTVVRYLDELEQEGHVEQVGGTGRGVCYRILEPK